MKKLLLNIMLGAIAVNVGSASEIKTLTKNGGWCWYQDERVIYGDDDTVVFGSVKSPEGDIDVSSWNLKTGEVKTKTLHEKLNNDDHAAPALLKLPNGNILMAWSTHGFSKNKDLDGFMYHTTTKNGADISQWEDVTKTVYMKDSKKGCYNNLNMLSDEKNRIYNFSRTYNYNPNWYYSDDMGKTFEYGGRFLHWDNTKGDPKNTHLDGNRPYAKYVSNGKDTIHFISTEAHPRGYDNSIYHGYLKGGKVYNSEGKMITELPKGDTKSSMPTDFTKVFDGNADNVAWTTDINLDENGNPVAVFSVQKDAGYLRKIKSHVGFDIRYFYARWDGKKWIVNQLAYAGEALYNVECDYSGLVAINPQNVNEVYISTNADPLTNRPLISTADGLRHYEIYKGITSDMGKTWKWEAITQNSKDDNIRPIVPINKTKNGKNVLLWTKGKMNHYMSYKLDIVGKIL